LHDAKQGAHVATHIAPIGFQIDDWIADQLSWAVVGNVSSAVYPPDLHIAGGELCGWGGYVRPIAPSTQGYRTGVFQQQNQIADTLGLASFQQLAL